MILGVERNRALRGAASGAVAAGVWALQQPLDKRVFGVPYDDLELLGKSVTRGPKWRPIGLAMHLGNGAVFGLVYCVLRDSLPFPPAARGPAAALTEHLTTWPMVSLSDRFHPARGEMPQLWGDRAAFIQALWRHLLFGFVLGELERRLNPPEPDPPPEPEATFSSNGHGSLEQAMSAGPIR